MNTLQPEGYRLTKKQEGYLSVLTKNWPSLYFRLFHKEHLVKKLTIEQASNLIQQIKDGAGQEEVEGYFADLGVSV